MHVLHLTSGMDFGGAQKLVAGLAEEAARHGHRVSVLGVMPGNDFEARLREAGVGFHTLGYRGRFTPDNLPALLRLRRALVRTVREIQPDVVHEHLFIPEILLYGMGALAGRPVLQTVHGPNPWWGRRGWYDRLQTHIDVTFARRTARFVAAVSRSVQAEAVRHLGVPPARCPLVYNFIDEPPAALAQARRRPRSRNVFVICRLIQEAKGLDTAVRAFREVRATVPDARLVFVGDGPDRDAVQALARALGVGHAVTFRGYQADVYAQLREADVVLTPSRREGFGLAAAEAQAAGVPVVASRAGGLPEVVADGETGFVCEPEDAAAFARRLTDVLTDGALYERLSAGAVAHVRARFTRRQAFAAYEELYAQTLEGHPHAV